MAKPTFPLLLLILLLAGVAKSRYITETTSDLVSDGISHVRPSSFLSLGFQSATDTCDQTYGFLPCTTTIFGNLFLILVYGYLMFKAATYLSNGSELLLQVLGPGIIGGLFLPILGALPDAMLILVSGLSGTTETAQSQVLIGMGLLAGSTVMLLTLLWGSCIVIGKCDLSQNSTSIDMQDTKRFSLTGSGVTTDVWTSYAARIMVISVVPFIIVQVPQIFNSSSGSRIAILISLTVSIVFLLSYCLYQIFQPWIQRRKLAYARHKHVISGMLKHWQRDALGKLLTDTGEPNYPVIKKLFERIDQNKNGSVSPSELSALIIGIHFEEIDLDQNDAVQKIMDEFDTSRNGSIDEDEFLKGIKKWLDDAKRSVPNPGNYSKKFANDFHQKTKEDRDMLVDNSDEAVEGVDNPTQICVKAVLLLLLGTVIAAVVSDPLVDAVDNFSTATSIPSFFISFIAMPMFTNSAEAVTAIIFASRKTQRSSSLTFSEIYGAATMNNILCLAVFLALVYVRDLTWDFSAEVLVILIVSIVMGLFGSFRTTFPLWTCSIAYLFYPLSLVLVYVLDYVFGWS
ncbi:sodium/calcium exchanger NCL1-like [Tasmannia lanceolata]|uniref:sodium/calcium exchanger NCL1-like n=1 Tax=Tasmannia lanceolata TaxID=3420 RepID=UPI00406340BB